MTRNGYTALIYSALVLVPAVWIWRQNTYIAPSTNSLPAPGMQTSIPQIPVTQIPLALPENEVIAETAVSSALIEKMAWVYPGAPTCGISFGTSSVTKISVLKAEYFKVNENGALILLTEKTSGCNGYTTANITTLKAKSDSQYVTISSSEASSMRPFLTAANKNTVIIQQLITFVNDNKITGVEIDFEDFGGWTASDYTNYKKFVTSLGTKLHASGKKLMIDGPATTDAVEEAWYKWRYADFVSLPVDKLVVMTYDYQFDQGAGVPIAPIAWIKNVINWTTKSFPDKSRLTFGIPSYGYKSVLGTGRYKLLTQEQMKKEPGFSTATRNAASGEMTWQNNGTVYFYQDTTSMNRKLNAIKSLGITSVSVWHIGGNPWFSN